MGTNSYSRSGPAPDPDALRRNRTGDQPWLRLPNRGVKDIPDWPIEALGPDTQPSIEQEACWRRIWAERPQAHIWAMQGMHMQVAAWVSLALHCANPVGIPAANMLGAFNRLSDALLLNPLPMRSARIKIDMTIEDPELDPRDARVLALAPKAAPGRARDRLKGGKPADDVEDEPRAVEDDE